MSVTSLKSKSRPKALPKVKRAVGLKEGGNNLLPLRDVPSLTPLYFGNSSGQITLVAGKFQVIITGWEADERLIAMALAGELDTLEKCEAAGVAT